MKGGNDTMMVFLATGSSDNCVKLWNVQTWEVMFTLRGHYDVIYSVTFNESGHALYSAGADGHVLKWQVVPMGMQNIR
jgi:transcription initiation factor TFIID subunit 5